MPARMMRSTECRTVRTATLVMTGSDPNFDSRDIGVLWDVQRAFAKGFAAWCLRSCQGRKQICDHSSYWETSPLVPKPCLALWTGWTGNTGLVGRCGDIATHTQHDSASGLMCPPATGDSEHLTEDDATHTTGHTGSRTWAEQMASLPTNRIVMCYPEKHTNRELIFISSALILNHFLFRNAATCQNISRCSGHKLYTLKKSKAHIHHLWRNNYR